MAIPRTDQRDGVRRHDEVVGYLLKHAHLELERRTDEALAPLGLTSRELGVLRVIVGGAARSQQETATLLGVDRTSMVAVVDALERMGAVARRPSDEDRRRNVLEATADGRALFRRAEDVSLAVERDFTAALGGAGAAELRAALRALL
ncbi:MarR family transcriptional regulator [Patulibacter sp. SYSU D01012]|uniref:MarR family winged helix-turn-helix transcriptional regulator n=1 Tax=Patulibacter sp. SYSU D01012 TaxID=2817381 RepID=UPI001B3016E7|nr:MarR family transcriptional regulator [Patulibacter sp. SYSU D01012]